MCVLLKIACGWKASALEKQVNILHKMNHYDLTKSVC